MAASLGESEQSAIQIPEVTTAQQLAVFFQDALACLHRLEQGQHRLEAELRRMQGQHLGDLPSTDQQPISSSDSQQARACACPAGNSDPEELSAFPESLNNEGKVELLEEALVTLDDEKAQSLQLKFVQSHRQSLREEQAEAHQNLFRAHNQARGWLVEHPFEPIEHDPEADAEARQRRKHVKSWLNTQITNGKFDLFFGLFIALNSILMVLRLEEQGQQLGYSHQFSFGPPILNQAEPPHYDISDNTLFWMELVFILIFTLELILRLWVRYRSYFHYFGNYVDTIIVLFAWVEMIIDPLPFNPAILRILRLGRFARIIRVIRVMHSFRALRVLVETTVASLQALIWSILLIGLILLVTACLMTGLTQWIFTDESVDREVQQQVWCTWGTFGHAFLTLLKWTLTAAWPQDTDLLIYGVNPWFGFFTFPFVLVVNFALMRVVSALFIKETFDVSRKDAMTVLEECMRKDNSTIDALRAIFVEFDSDGKGGVSKEEFDRAMEDPRLQDCLKSLEVDPRQACGLFTLLDHGLGQLSPEELTAGAMDIRAGVASPIDVMTARYENLKTMLVLRNIEQQVHMVLKFLEHTIVQTDDVKQKMHANVDLGQAHLNKRGAKMKVSM